MLRLTPLLITLKNLLAQALLYFNGEVIKRSRRLGFLWFKTLFCGSKFYGKTHFLSG